MIQAGGCNYLAAHSFNVAFQVFAYGAFYAPILPILEWVRLARQVVVSEVAR